MEAKGGTARRYTVIASRSLPKGFVILGSEPVYLVGRGTGCQILLLGDEVTRRHAKIEGEGIRFKITDLGSTNGTRVNGEVLEPNKVRRLSPGDEIGIGHHKLLFTVSEGTREELAQKFDGSQHDTDRLALTKKKANLSGTLGASTLPEVCQLIELNKHSGELRASSGGITGSVKFREGTIVDARCGPMTGQQAARQVMAFTSGNYSFEQAAGEPPTGPLALKPTALTMDLLRSRDEKKAKTVARPVVDERDFMDEAPAAKAPPRSDDDDTEVLPKVSPLVDTAPAPPTPGGAGDKTRKIERPLWWNLPPVKKAGGPPTPPGTPKP